MVCPGDWDKAPGLKDALVNLPTGTLLSVNEDGSRKQRGVKVAEFDERYIYVQAARPAEDFFQGMSGSSLELGNQRAGMLLQVDLERGYGVVIRQDYLTNAIAPFFDAASAAGSVEEVLTLLGSLEGEARLEALRSSASKIPSNISGSAAGRILLGLREEHRVRGLEIFVDKLKSNLDAKELNKIVSNEPGRTRVGLISLLDRTIASDLDPAVVTNLLIDVDPESQGAMLRLLERYIRTNLTADELIGLLARQTAKVRRDSFEYLERRLPDTITVDEGTAILAGAGGQHRLNMLGAL